MARKVRAWFQNPRLRSEKKKNLPAGFLPLYSDGLDIEVSLHLPPVVAPQPPAPPPYYQSLGMRATKLAKGVVQDEDGTKLYYDPQDPVTRGSFGRFFEGMLSDGTLVGVKELALLMPKNNAERKPRVTPEATIKRELLAMERCGSAVTPAKVLVTSRETITRHLDNKVLLVMPRMEACLFDRLTTLPLDATRGLMMVEMAEALIAELQRIHARRMLHCDVKPDNILIDNLEATEEKPRRFVLADFGLAQDLRYSPLKFSGTPAYAAPEVLAGMYIGKESDVWSLGVTLLQALTGCNPFQDYDNTPEFAMARHQEWARFYMSQPTEFHAHTAFSKAIAVVQTYDDAMGTPWRKLLGHMLNPDPNQRPRASKALKGLSRHPLTSAQRATANRAWSAQSLRDVDQERRIARLRGRWAQDLRNLQQAV